MTDERLDELQRLADAATPGGWEARGTLVKTPPTPPTLEEMMGVTTRRVCVCEPSPYMGKAECEANAALIAAARTALPELIAEVRRLREELRRDPLLGDPMA